MTDLTSTEAWLSLLSSLVLAYRRPTADCEALASHSRQLVAQAAPTLKALRADSRAYALAARAMAAGPCSRNGMPTPRYARSLLAVRDAVWGSTERRERTRKYLYSSEFNEQQQRLAANLIGMLSPDSLTVEKKDKLLDRQLVILPDRTLRAAAVPATSGSQHAGLAEIKHLVQKWTGRSDARLGQMEAKEIKERDPERYKHYLKLRKGLNEVYQSFIRNLTRVEGRPVKIFEAKLAMAKAGITSHPLDGLERLRIGEDLKLYSPAGKELVGMPAPGSRIVFNPAYDPRTDNTYVFKFKVPNGVGDGMTKVYTREQLLRNKDSRTDKIMKAIESVPARRPRWVKDLRSSDPTRRTLAAMTELLYSHAMRIGSVGNQKGGVDTYGLATLDLRHVRTTSDGGFILSYPGKGNQPQRHVVRPDTPENQIVVGVIRRMLRGKQRRDSLWTDSRGERIGADRVNAYLKSVGLPITAHKFRHVRGTMLMQNLLAEARIAKTATQPQVERKVKDLAINVGKLLGHIKGTGKAPTAATAIRAYIAPVIIADFFRARGLRIPGWLPAAGRGED